MTAIGESGCRRGSGPQTTIRACERLNSSGNGSLLSGLRVELGHRLRFLGRYLRDPNTVGASGGGGGQRVYVVESDISNAQKRVAVIQSQSLVG